MPSPNHGTFIWCELMTTDMNKAAAFYGSVIGWNAKTMPMPDMEGEDYGIFDTRAGDEDCGVAGFMTLPPEMAGQIPPNWTGYIGVDDVDDMVARFKAEGGSVRKEAFDVPGVGRMAVVADPHGAVLCIMTPLPMDNPPPMAPIGSPGTFGWQELYAGDGREALAFYGRMFGWTLDHAMPMGEMGDYLIFSHQGRQVGGMMTRPPTVPVPCWSYYINVPSVTEAAEKISKGGGTVVFGPQDVPGGSQIVQAMDPQGAFFAVVSPA
ncbi:VOC family protein [Rhizobium sp. SSA_523]|uniref:VOC family protein n=1 Tax=Rhizobium sp. SSA_523 TaxID=2952477 RepID=UPI002091995D|nr:VOC family protein [Rhizobium sp. SSA_523]MCO5731901.1 VOC family protein [Rhizobium sp. SSA_523]WKC22743.1 VOC family protein [Rhizobium sp. SSA_523]